VTTRPFAERLVLVTLYSKDDWFSARLTEGVQGENFAQEQKLADDTRDSWPGLRRKAVLADHIRTDARALTVRVFPNSQGAPPLHGLIRA
jgi:hypothetical protein